MNEYTGKSRPLQMSWQGVRSPFRVRSFAASITMALVFFGGSLCVAPADGADIRSAKTDEDRPLLGSPAFRPSPEYPFGWRGDGSGRYPGATPPLHWGRESVAVSQLRCQAAKPKEGETGKPMAQGVIPEWLVAGPIEVPMDFKVEKDALVADAGALRPAEGEELAGTGVAWKKFVFNSTVLDLSALLGRDHKPLPPVEVLVHTYVFSSSAGAYGLHFKCANSGRLQAFVNSKNVASGTVDLVKGWNSILFKILSGKSFTYGSNNEELDLRVSFFGTWNGEYAVRNVAWMRETPSSVSASTPIIAGDRLFVTSEYRTLCCLDKRNGKMLWVRTSTFYDAMTDEEKNANPEIVKEIEPLAAKLRKIDAGRGRQAGTREADQQVDGPGRRPEVL